LAKLQTKKLIASSALTVCLGLWALSCWRMENSQEYGKKQLLLTVVTLLHCYIW